KNASFYFHPNDEEEVSKISVPKEMLPQKKYSLDKILNKLVETLNLSLDEEQTKRLRDVIVTLLRDRRTIIDASEVLERPQEEGGVGFESEIIDKVLAFLRDIKDKVNKEKGIVIDEDIERLKEESSFIPPTIIPKKKIVKQVIQEELPEKVEPLIKTTTKFNRPKKKGKLDDISKEYKLVGPVEELASLTLATFRRLGADPERQAQKISDKINLLTNESLIKKAKGLNAWRRSPLYKMYLAIGQASMEHNMSVADVIKQYVDQGKEIMTSFEFDAISDLNTKLRF
ncbi:hypothetical protein HOE31_02675, partial [bacterium]|nr:hypothetical protein [bacterium]